MSLELLASLAVSNDAPFTPCNESPATHCRATRGASSVKPNRRFSTSNGCKALLKASTKSFKGPRSQKAARDDKQSRQRKMKTILEQSKRIKTVGNSPVNPAQLRLLQGVYRNVTKFPPDYWIALIAVLIRRTFIQVKTWFSNQRQHTHASQVRENLPEDEVVQAKTEEGVAIKFRPSALELGDKWSDDLFEGVLYIYHMRR
ncbi:hypothetical protein C8J56DRAFT_299129 [Mycena floridula]|nr:hypothetical protein C8J56DRAFT_299129 [Mycena floridula]